METSLLLTKSILELFIYVAIGYGIVKSGIMTTKESKVLSMFVIYIATPCMIIHAFQMKYDFHIVQGLLLAVFAALSVNLIYILMTRLLTRFVPLNTIERGTLIYSNAGNFVIPLVISMLGNDWVLYSCGYVIVQIFLLWTHGVVLISEEKNINIKNLLLNINILSIFAGVLLFFFHVEIPVMIDDVMITLGNMMGPLAMVVIGMSFADMDIKKLLQNKRCFAVCLLRLTIYPFVIVILMKLTGAAYLLPDADAILFITTLQSSAPAAAMVTQLAQIYNKDAAYASALNILSVILCVITMPLIISIYELLL